MSLGCDCNGFVFLLQVYLNNKAAIDPILEKVKVQLDELQSKVGGFMPKKTAEAKKEE